MNFYKLSKLIEAINNPPMPERGNQPGFEEELKRNPLDSTAHMVYADYLDEQGNEEEARFQRAIGKWLERSPVMLRTQGELRCWIQSTHLPEGVTLRDLFTVPVNSYGRLTKGRYPPGTALNSAGILSWRTYQEMETGLRNAFFHQVNPQQEKERQRQERRRMDAMTTHGADERQARMPT